MVGRFLGNQAGFIPHAPSSRQRNLSGSSNMDGGRLAEHRFRGKGRAGNGQSSVAGMPMACKAVQRRFRSCLPRFGLGLLRNPLPGSWSQEHPGYLVRGNPSSLNDAASPAFVGRRLSHFSCNISALWTLSLQTRGRSGINRFMNERYHYDLAVKLINGEKRSYSDVPWGR